jgi:hypothetical protein
MVPGIAAEDNYGDSGCARMTVREVWDCPGVWTAWE